jgi:anti-sigma factor RsiW
MSDEDQDQELVALIDNELDKDRRNRLLARLEEDPALRARYEALRGAGAPLGAAFDALLERAPLARLRNAIPPETAIRRVPARFSGLAFRELAAGFALGLLAAGVAAWLALGALPGDEDSDWRGAVVDYMGLYTNETFASASPDRETQAKELSSVGKRLGANLTPENVAMPGLDFKVAFILAFEGAPLGEMAYVDPTGAPVLFCVIHNGAADAPLHSEKRSEFALASWTRDGRGYLVIGRKPEQEVAELARTLETRFR